MEKYRVPNRINLLRAREYGLEDSFVSLERSRRLVDLTLCKYRNLTPYHHSSISTMDLDPSEFRYLLSSGSNGHICCHDMFPSRLVATHPILFQIDRRSSPKDHHTHDVVSLQWYPNDNGAFITLGLDKKLKIWDTNRMKMVDEYKFQNFAYVAQMPSATNTSMIAVAHDSGDLRFIDIRSGSDTHIIHTHRGRGVCVLKWFHQNPHQLVSGGVDGRVLFTDIRTARGHYMCLDRDHVLTEDTSAKSRSNKAIAHAKGVKALQILPDSDHLLTLAEDQQMYLWNIHRGQRVLVNYGPVPTDKSRLIGLACAQMRNDRNKSVIYVPCGKTFRTYDIFTGQRLASLTGHLMRVNCCIYNQQTVELYSCSDSILVWAAVSKQQDDYEKTLKTQERRNDTNRSLGQVLNRDQWSDDEDADEQDDGIDRS